MPRVSEEFSSDSRFLKALDLGGKRFRVRIVRVGRDEVGDDGEKWVLYFEGAQKGLVLNKTNARTIAESYGDELEGWVGKDIFLFSKLVDYQGRDVPGIRVDTPHTDPIVDATEGQL